MIMTIAHDLKKDNEINDIHRMNYMNINAISMFLLIQERYIIHNLGLSNHVFPFFNVCYCLHQFCIPSVLPCNGTNAVVGSVLVPGT